MLRFMVDEEFVCFKLLLFWCENRPEISLSQSRRSWEKGGVGITGRSFYFITKTLDGGLVSRECRQWSLSNGQKVAEDVWGAALFLFVVAMTARCSAQPSRCSGATSLAVIARQPRWQGAVGMRKPMRPLNTMDAYRRLS